MNKIFKYFEYKLNEGLIKTYDLNSTVKYLSNVLLTANIEYKINVINNYFELNILQNISSEKLINIITYINTYDNVHPKYILYFKNLSN